VNARQAFPNIERIDSGPSYLDRTFDAADAMFRQDYNDALTRHRREFNAMELGDLCCDDALLSAVRSGDPSLVGHVLLGMYEQKLRDLAAWAAEAS
jgi:hypothetical protein